MGYSQEIDALQRWVFQVSGLKSHRLSVAPPKVARPVILWEGPNRTKGQNMGRYQYTTKVSQFGKLYVNDLTQLADLLEKLEKDLGDRDEWLPVYEDSTADAIQVGRLRNVQLDTNTAETVDFPITVKYEVAYSRPVPTDAPRATSVTNKPKGGLLNG